MIGCFVVAFVAGEDARAAAEAEPAVGFAVVWAAAEAGERLAGGYAEGFFWLRGREGVRFCFGGWREGGRTFLRTGARPIRVAELTRRNFTSGILKSGGFG